MAGAALVVCLGLDVWALTAASGRADASAPPDSSRSSRAVAVPAGSIARTPAALPRERLWATPSPTTSAGTQATPTVTVTPPVVQRGDGRFTVLPVPAGAIQKAPTTGRTIRYTVEVEGGLGIDDVEYARTVATVLSDQRGWQAEDHVRFVNVSPEQAEKGARVDLRVSLTSPDTTDRLCAPLQTRGQVSCYANGRAVLNVRRWLLGVEDAYGKDVASYRIYLVNHEVGHSLGHGHESCPGPGKVAPVMMQQSYGVKGCVAWPWPTAKPA